MIPDLSFDLTARDLTNPAFASLTSKAERADAQVKTLGDRFAGLGRKVSAISAGAAALAGIGIGAGVMDALGAWEELALAVAKVDQAVISTGMAAGHTTDELAAMASKLQGLSTFDDDDIMGNVTAQLLTFTKVAGPEFERAQGLILDMSVLLEKDLASSAQMVGKALNDPVRGITALSKAGVQFSEDQRAMVRSMVETGDIAGAQGVILGELATQFGGQAARAAQEGLGPLKQIQNAWGDFKEEIGAGAALLLPPITAALKALVSGFAALPEPVKLGIGAFAGAAAIILPVGAALGVIVTGLTMLSPLLPAVGAAFAALTGPIGLTVAGLTAIGVAIYSNWDKIEQAFPGITAAIQGGLTAAGLLLDSFVTHVGLFVTGIGQLLTGDFAGLWQTASGVMTNFGEAFMALVEVAFPGAIDALTGKLAELWQAFVTMKDKALEAVSALVTGVQSWLTEKLTGVFDSVASKIDWVGEKFRGLYEAVVGHSYVPDMVLGVESWMGRLATSMPEDAQAATGGVDTAFEGLGSSISSGLKSALADGKVSMEEFRDIGISVLGKFKDWVLDQMFAPIESGLSSLFSGLFGGGGFGGTTKFASGILSGVFAGLFAAGGTIPSGQWGIVGEAGPEIVQAGNGPISVSPMAVVDPMPVMAAQAAGRALRLDLYVTAEEGPMLRPTIRAESRDMAVQVTEQGIAQYDRGTTARFGETTLRNG